MTMPPVDVLARRYCATYTYIALSQPNLILKDLIKSRQVIITQSGLPLIRVWTKLPKAR